MILETKEQQFEQIWIIQSRALICRSFNFLYAALSGSTLLKSVMSQHYNSLMELYNTNVTNFTLHENTSSLYFYTSLGMLELRWLCMHLWLNLINWSIIKKNLKIYTCTKSLESCSVVVYHRFWQSYRLERAT